jgi:hypothetical protein
MMLRRRSPTWVILGLPAADAAPDNDAILDHQKGGSEGLFPPARLLFQHGPSGVEKASTERPMHGDQVRSGRYKERKTKNKKVSWAALYEKHMMPEHTRSHTHRNNPREA